MTNDKNDVDKDVNVKKRKENPSKVGSTFIKYAAYIIILIIILYFLIRYVFPMF